MPLKPSSGNMYSWVTHTWNPVRGKCDYDCSYCYVKKWGEPRPLRFDEAEMRTNLGEGNFIFICSGCDLFHPSIPDQWIELVLKKTRDFPRNKYLWHTKNPAGIVELQGWFNNWPGIKHVLCVTIESNRHYPGISAAPPPWERFAALKDWESPWMLTIEPVMDFDITEFAVLIDRNMPVQVNIGADSGGNNLPEPIPEKLDLLIGWLKTKTKVCLKKNLGRLLTA